MIQRAAIINTKEGKLEGLQIDGIYRFLGVRYAESTEGENRFMPPRPLKPWEGVRSALTYAAKCWQTDTPRMEDPEIRCTRYPKDYEKLMTGSNEMGAGFQSEDCCAVNIWTAGLRDGRKRPIMVWFHGGGNIAGAAEANWHDGFNMAKKQDVVMVSVGHRLGIFGYLYLAEFDERFKDSANVGHQDMVAALRWIKENAEELGGDPDNITIFGQSGGGGKVAALMAMPMAKGLVHKAIIQSGGFHLDQPSDGTAMAKQLLDFLGIEEKNAADLQKYSAEELIAATRAINKTRTVGTYFVCPLVQDGRVLAFDPFDGAEGTALSKDIALISGYTKNDGNLRALFDPPVFSYTFEELPEKLEAQGYTAKESEEIVGIYRRELGEDCTACDVYTGLANDKQHLLANIARSDARSRFPDAAPMYNYVFCREGNDPELKAIHGVEIPFFFLNAEYAPALWTTDTRVEAMQLSEAAGAAWASFARTGNPSNPLLPVWKPYDAKDRYTMLIDVDSRLVSDYRKEAREFLTK